MLSVLPYLRLSIGAEHFSARLRRDLAPLSCAHLEKLLPYHGKIVHARWSGEAIWSPLAATWPDGLILPPENHTDCPLPGEVLLFAGVQSEPELLFAYGITRFASNAGPIAGNPVLTIQNGQARLAELGRKILWHGAIELCIERTGPLSVGPSGKGG